MLRYTHSTNEDLPQLAEWVAADPDHAETTKPEFFVLQPNEKGKQCIKVEDDNGVVFYLKFTNALIIDVQFPPNDRENRERLRHGLNEAFTYFSISAKRLDYHAMLFKSASKSLTAFFRIRGFKQLLDFFKVDL